MYELKKKLKRLRDISGSGTELISVYMPHGYPIAEMSNKLRDEHGQAGNIKSKTTRKNVLDALEKIIQYLKTFREVPENGLAIFCGNISTQPGNPDIQLFSIVPPEPIQVQFYRCDSKFSLEPLEEMLAARDVYGLVVLDGKEATLALLKGKTTKVLTKIHSFAHSKLGGKGGQSSRRFQRIIEEEIENYYKRIGESMTEAFLNTPNFVGVIVGGPGPAKENFLKLKPFNYQLKILGVVDTGYTDEYGLREVTEKAEPLISEQEAVKEKKVVDWFLKEVSKDGLAVYGVEKVKEALLGNKVELLLISERLDLQRVRLKCNNCGKEEEKLTSSAQEENCSCGGKLKVLEDKDLVEELIELAEKKGTKVEMISTDTAEGNQFFMGFQGVGAILRYR
jgi:peptide chain release factor subunit 1